MHMRCTLAQQGHQLCSTATAVAVLPAAAGEDGGPAAAAPASTQLLEVPALPPASHARSLCEELLQEALREAAAGSGAIAWFSGAKAPFSFEELLARDMQLEEGSAHLPLVLLDDDTDQVGRAAAQPRLTTAAAAACTMPD